MFSLQNKTIILFGGSGLIGSALKPALEEAGAVVLAPTRGEVDITPTATNPGWDFTPCQRSLREYIGRIADDRRIDGVVNAIWPRDASTLGKFGHHTHNFIVYQESRRMMREHGGSIVCFGSVYGKIKPDPEMYEGTEYEGSIDERMKYAEAKRMYHEEVQEYYAKEAAPQQVRINVVAPGGIFNGHSERFRKQYEERVPMGRMGRVEDVTGAVVFLLSDASSYITGNVIFVDGGFVL